MGNYYTFSSKKYHYKISIGLVLIFLVAALCNRGVAQSPEKKRFFPIGIANYQEGDVYLKLTYGRPEKRGKFVFGYQVPFRRIWRTGADDATELYVSDTVYVDSVALPPGMYALFSIPDTAAWTMILNTEPGQWGLYRYDYRKDWCRIRVPRLGVSQAFEQMTCYFERTDEGADLIIGFGYSAVRVPFRWKKP